MKQRMASMLLMIGMAAALLFFGGCDGDDVGAGTAIDDSASQGDDAALADPSAALDPDHDAGEPGAAEEALPDDAVPYSVADGYVAASIDELWTILDGAWVFEEFLYDGKVTNYPAHDLYFTYVDGKPCMSTDYEETQSRDVFFYDIASISAIDYDGYIYKRDKFGSEGDNWSSDVRLVWWHFDLTNFDDGEIVLTYHVATDAIIDDSNTFVYRRR